ncbi:MAG: hypothetical protein E6H95_03410 [Chloroflexi bacterium]|nr:MAG: hypothetical protein E6H95_03410 [Chloroflexota bacterium]
MKRFPAASPGSARCAPSSGGWKRSVRRTRWPNPNAASWRSDIRPWRSSSRTSPPPAPTSRSSSRSFARRRSRVTKRSSARWRRKLNPGGRATLRHADGDDGPRSGVEILVQPPRKRLQNVTLLSSGERSLAALALVLALDEVNPSPFTILDEVDAALDDANVDRFGQMVARLGAQRQFLVITHNHVTMSYASTLYGIHLDESGSSHLVSVRLDDIRKPATRAATTAQAG